MTALPVSPLLIGAVIFVFGAIVGSFLNVCIVRLPKDESVVHPPSHCPQCGAGIRFYDNIPLVSYVLLLGRCRSCGERISARYFLVELLMAALAVSLYYEFGLGLAFVVSFIFVAALIVVSFIDLDVRIIPDEISLSGIVLGLLFSIIARYLINDPFEVIPSPLSSLLGVLIGGGFLLAVGWAYEACTGIEGMGGGDVKLFAMIGAFLGAQSLLVTLILASLGGSAIGLTVILVKRVGRRYPIPFGPFLCLGALLYLFFGRELLQLYPLPG